MKRWPGCDNQLREKVPCILAYDDHFERVIAWGHSVGDHHKNKFAYFKLLLHRQTMSDSVDVDDIVSKLDDLSIRSTWLPSGKTAVNITADYLGRLYQYLQQILSNTYVEKFLATQTVSYVITVPVLWSDRSRVLMLCAAKEAGFNGEVILVTESEAAALYCVADLDEIDLHIGLKFLGKRRLSISMS